MQQSVQSCEDSEGAAWTSIAKVVSFTTTLAIKSQAKVWKNTTIGVLPGVAQLWWDGAKYIRPRRKNDTAILS